MLKPFITRERWQQLVWARPRSVTIFGLHQLLAAVLLVLSMLPGSSVAGLLCLVLTFPFFVLWPIIDAHVASSTSLYTRTCIAAWLLSGVFWTAVTLGVQGMWRS